MNIDPNKRNANKPDAVTSKPDPSDLTQSDSTQSDLNQSDSTHADPAQSSLTEHQTPTGQSFSKKLSMQATTPPADVPGYRIKEFLGAGAFGQVWVGRDLNTGRDVAVKFYLHRGGVNWSLLSREVKNLVQLSADRYVVQVLEVGWDAEPPYYVMELISGGSLEDLLQTRGRLPLDESVEMFRRICIGLNRCHAKGVLHCDIKPANILLGDDDEPRLADFGQSRLSDDQTPALGTLFYMAPEQADVHAVPDASWDVYAVGAIMFRLLTGQPPYRADHVVEQLDTAGSLEKRLKRYREAIATTDPPTQHLQREGMDRMLGRIVSKCLAANPSDRYANVQQILQDLNRRDAIRARQPLMLLGIVGPLLVLLATCFFGASGINEATDSTEDALIGEAIASNRLAAAFAARTLENEIDRYYRLTREEGERESFVDQLKKTLANEEVQQALSAIAEMKTPLATASSSQAREQLLDSPVRRQLDRILQERLAIYSDADRRRRRLASMFVTDAVGTIVSIAYENPVARDENSTGRNYCYRTYFHGGRADLAKDSIEIGEITPLESTHISAAFLSTATGSWKVAISTPIYLSEDQRRPEAMFVVTVNLGDFELLQSEPGGNLWAVLVEVRPDDKQGTILQHPMMEQKRTSGVTITGEKYLISPDQMTSLLAGSMKNYRDPMGDAKDGQDYAGEWIAAMQPVLLPAEDQVEASPNKPSQQTPKKTGDDAGRDTEMSDRRVTDLQVLVQYRLEAVVQPVETMRWTLLWQGIAALFCILLVTICVWLLVRRFSNPGAERRDESVTDSKFAETMTIR